MHKDMCKDKESKVEMDKVKQGNRDGDVIKIN